MSILGKFVANAKLSQNNIITNYNTTTTMMIKKQSTVYPSKNVMALVTCFKCLLQTKIYFK